MALPVQHDVPLALFESGFQFIPAAITLELLGGLQRLTDWSAFAKSWDRLEVDTYMADKGRYRRRRHALYTVRAGQISAAPHRAHFQGLNYNALNGGIERWYTPIDAALAQGPTLKTILGFCAQTFSDASSDNVTWDVEVHQFRIEASAGIAGQPTPEGMHRDGVDYVLVLLIDRVNVASGTTLIGGEDGSSYGSFTLIEPFDAVMLDDHRVYHGVTAIAPLAPGKEAHRDVLVVTFRALEAPR